MGTSSIYNGPNDKNPLLPEGFEEDFNEDQNYENLQEVNTSPGTWKETKKAMSQYVTGNSPSKGRILRNYIKASGGGRTASKNAVTGRNTMMQLGRFLSSISKEGFIRTMEMLQIDFIGKNVGTLLSEVVNIICNNSSTKEDIIARTATLEALYQIYEYIEENDMEISCLDSIDDVLFHQIMNSYISSYIYERILNDLQRSFEAYAENNTDALEKEHEFKEYIQSSVEIKLNDIRLSKIDYYDEKIEDIVENVYTQCYQTLEVCL